MITTTWVEIDIAASAWATLECLLQIQRYTSMCTQVFFFDVCEDEIFDAFHGLCLSINTTVTFRCGCTSWGMPVFEYLDFADPTEISSFLHQLLHYILLHTISDTIGNVKVLKVSNVQTIPT